MYLFRLVGRKIAMLISRYFVAYFLTFIVSFVMSFLVMTIIDHDYYGSLQNLIDTSLFLAVLSIPFSFVSYYLLNENRKYKHIKESEVH